MNYAVVTLDASGSMSGQEDRVVQSMNEYAQTLPTDANLTVFQFDSERWITFYDGLVGDYRPMTLHDYQTGRMTPLFDAIGKSLAHVSKVAKADDRVFVMIDTDGFENASKEHSQESIKAMVEARKADGWAFLFMSQGLDVAHAEAHGHVAQAMSMETSAAVASSRGANYHRAGGQTASYFSSGAAPRTMAVLDEDQQEVDVSYASGQGDKAVPVASESFSS